jgi:mitochondrial fission protein ELM1
MAEALLPLGVRVLILSSGKAGHETNCLGVATALGAPYEIRIVKPRRFYESLSPYGPIDPKDRLCSPDSLLTPPLAQIVIACGRITTPYIRALKRSAPNDIFAVFLQDPVVSRGVFDLIWAPAHDRLAGSNVFSTVTSPHPFGALRLAEERREIDPRLQRLDPPRAAILLGGPSAGHNFDDSDLSALSAAMVAICNQGYSVMATRSRRTSGPLIEAVRKGLGGRPSFIWDGDGKNPYAQMLAHADVIFVTGDSVNMVGEALATGAPVYLFEPSGSGGKSRGFIASLKELGLVRRFNGRIEAYSYTPIDSSRAVAEEVARRFAISRAGKLHSPQQLG